MKNTFFKVPDEKLHDVCFTSASSEEWEKRIEADNGIIPSGGSGLYSNAEDLAIFGQMLLNKGIYNGSKISGRKTVEKMTVNNLKPGIPNNCWNANVKNMTYGLGMHTRTDNTIFSEGTFSHEGSGRSAIMIDPVEEIVFSYFTPIREGNASWQPRAVMNIRNVILAGVK